MSTPKHLLFVALAASIPLTVQSGEAQSAPTQYTLTQADSPGATTIYRSGSKVLTEGGTPRTLSFYDLAAGTYSIWKPDSNPIKCSSGKLTSDWGDPFNMSAGVGASIRKGEVKLAGYETVAGIPTQIYTASSDQGSSKVWYDAKDNIVLRAIFTLPGAAPTTMVDIRKISLAPPSPALFTVPAACSAVEPPPPNPSIAEVTGGDDPANYVDAIYAAPSKNSCNVVLKVVHVKTMAPVTNIQAAIDTAYDPDHPQHCTIQESEDGRRLAHLEARYRTERNPAQVAHPFAGEAAGMGADPHLSPQGGGDPPIRGADRR